MKNEKNYMGFLIQKNIAKFEAFPWNISLSANLLFLKSENVLLSRSNPSWLFFFASPTVQASIVCFVLACKMPYGTLKITSSACICYGTSLKCLHSLLLLALCVKVGHFIWNLFMLDKFLMLQSDIIAPE